MPYSIPAALPYRAGGAAPIAFRAGVPPPISARGSAATAADWAWANAREIRNALYGRPEILAMNFQYQNRWDH